MKNIGQRIANLTPEQRALLALRRKKLEEQKSSEGDIPLREGDGPWPASADQAALWFFSQMDPKSSAYNVGNGQRLVGLLSMSIMEAAFNEMVRIHEVMRTSIQEIDGKPCQVVIPEVKLQIAMADMRGVPEKERMEAAKKTVTRMIKVPFDLSRGPLTRLVMVQLDDHDYVMICVLHHSVTDWWSFKVFFRDVMNCYLAFAEGKPSPLEPLPIQFIDYALWRNKWMGGPEYQRQLDYWLKKLEGAPPVVEIRPDLPRPVMQSAHGARDFKALPPAVVDGANRMARSNRVTLQTVWMAGVFAFLHRYAGYNDLVMGSGVAVHRDYSQTKNLIGYLLNTLPYRAIFHEGMTFAELLEQMRTSVFESFKNSDIPFRALVEAINPPRDMSRMPVYQIEFIHVYTAGQDATHDQTIADLSMDTRGLKLKHFPIDRQTSPVDMQFCFLESPDGVIHLIEYCTDLYLPQTAKYMNDLLSDFLEEAFYRSDEPINQLAWLKGDHREWVLREWNCGNTIVPEVLLFHRYFESAAAVSPHNTALTTFDGTNGRGSSLSYYDLNLRAESVARRLRERGVGPETVVGLCAAKSCDMVVAMLGILKAGGVYMPLDVDYPESRLKFMLEDSGAALVLADEKGLRRLEGSAVSILALDAGSDMGMGTTCTSSDNGAYLLYTSGSTGTPKGALVTHQGAANFIGWFSRTLGDCLATAPAAASTSFDMSLIEIMAPLSVGGRVVLMDDFFSLAALPEDLQPTFAMGTPTAMRALIEAHSLPESLTTIGLGGEALSRLLVSRLYALPNVSRVINFYGPTEASVCTLSAEMGGEPSPAPALGRPIDNHQIHLLDGFLNPQPPMVTGRLFIAGMGLARGYHGRPDLTAVSFIPNPFSDQPGGRMYDSGDVGYWNLNGGMMFEGRSDHQVKVRGYRVEPGEIEAALEAQAGVVEAIVVAREDVPGERRLVAYLVAEKDAAEDLPATLRAALSGLLPNYMVPALFVVVASLPRTPAGKLDREALSMPVVAPKEKVYEAPRDETERILVKIWSDILKVEKLGIHDNFFELGGDSIMGVVMGAKSREHGLVVTPRLLFTHQTIAELAPHVKG